MTSFYVSASKPKSTSHERISYHCEMRQLPLCCLQLQLLCLCCVCFCTVFRFRLGLCDVHDQSELHSIESLMRHSVFNQSMKDIAHIHTQKEQKLGAQTHYPPPHIFPMTNNLSDQIISFHFISFQSQARKPQLIPIIVVGPIGVRVRHGIQGRERRGWVVVCVVCIVVGRRHRGRMKA